jgi:DNA polymerase
MSVDDTDVRRELSEIARAARRIVERERAAGLGDLLARSAAAARRPAGREDAPGGTAPAGDERSSDPPAAAASGTSAPGIDARRVLAHAFEAPAPAPRAEPAAPPAPVATNLFGEPEPAPEPAPADSGFSLPSHHAPLNPAGVAARAPIHSASLAVLEQIAGEVRECRKCGLCETRTNAVPGVGSAASGIVFVGEAPGADEDRRGEPFVGRAGELLTRIIKAMDDQALIPGVPLSRETVYICNVLKCRPPENRNPLPHEIEMCAPYLRRQLEALRPKVICCLGKFAAELLLGVKGTIAALRGSVYRFHGAKLIVTYHPAACLRNPNYKRPVWEDMQRLAHEYQSD